MNKKTLFLIFGLFLIIGSINVFGTSIILQLNTTSGQDSFNDFSAPTVVQHPNTGNIVQPYSLATNVKRILLRWDNLNQIPVGSILDNVTIQMYLEVISGAGTQTTNVHLLTANWTDSQMTWNNRLTGIAWTTAGGDYNATVLGNWTNDGTLGFYNVTLNASLVQQIISDPSKNFGFMIKGSNEGLTINNRLYTNSENASTTKRPYLFITYHQGVSNFTITSKNNYNNNSINNFSAIINGTTYNTTTGTITTPILTNSTLLWNITLFSSNMFNKTYTNVNVSSALDATQDQYPIIYLTNKWNNSNLTNFSIINNVTNIDTYNFETGFDGWTNEQGVIRTTKWASKDNYSITWSDTTSSRALSKVVNFTNNIAYLLFDVNNTNNESVSVFINNTKVADTSQGITLNQKVDLSSRQNSGNLNIKFVSNPTIANSSFVDNIRIYYYFGDSNTGYIYFPYNGSAEIVLNKTNYIPFDGILNLLPNTINQINVSQSIINFSLREFDNNVSILNFTLNITGYGIPTGCNTTGSSCLIYPNNGTYNYSIINNSGQDFFTPINNTLTVNELDNFTYYAYVTEHYINVTAKNIINNASINNFSIHLTDLTDGTDVRDFNTTNGVILIPVIHHTYNLTINASSFVIQSQSIVVNTSISANSIINQTFYLYKVNSITFNIYDINTLQLVNSSTSTIFMQGVLNTYTFTTNNGTSYQDGLANDIYSITVSNPNYANSFQIVTLNGNEHFNINFYLINTSNLFQFYLISNLPTDNGNKISQGTCTFYYPNNGSTITVGSFTTDFSGSGTIYLDTTKTYTYICQATNYIPYQNTIKPIIASSPYSIYMTSTGGTPYTNVLNGAIISTSMSYSYPSTNAYFYYNLNSVDGLVNYFGLSTTYNNNLFIVNNTGNSMGGLLTLNVTSLTLDNRTITISYWYKFSGYDYQTWNTTYYLPIVIGGNMTLTQGIFVGNNSITDTNTNPMNPVALGLVALLIPIAFMIFMHMFGMPKVLVILLGLAGDGIIIMSNMFSQMPNSAKIMTVLGMSMTIIFIFLIADNKDSVGLN